MKKIILLTLTTILLLNCSNGANEPCKDENCITDEQLNFFKMHLEDDTLTKKVLFEMSSMDLSSKDITSLDTGIFNNLTNLTSVDLTDNPICSVDKGDVGLANTVTVNLTPIDARCLTDEQLNFFKMHLEDDTLTKKVLFEMSSMDLSSKDITSLDTGIFNNLTNLTSVDLTDNPICSVDKGDVGLANVVTLTFGNYCSEVTDEQLTFFSSHILSLDTKKKLYEATSLDLSGKSIASLEAGIFNNLTSLTSVDLSSNALTSIPAEIGNLTSLTWLWLNENALTDIPTEIGNLRNLTTLSLSFNDLTSIPTDIGNLTNLTSLWLNENDLTNIPAEIGNLANLTFLNLGGNKLISIPDGIFNNLTNLTWLELKNSSSDTNMLTCDRANYTTWGLDTDSLPTTFFCNN